MKLHTAYVLSILSLNFFCYSAQQGPVTELDIKRGDFENKHADAKITAANRDAYQQCMQHMRTYGGSCFTKKNLRAYAAVSTLLTKHPLLVNAATTDNESPLYASAIQAHRHGDYDLFKLILTHDTNEKRRIHVLEAGIISNDPRIVNPLKQYSGQIRKEFLTLAAMHAYKAYHALCGNSKSYELFDALLELNNNREQQQEALEYAASVADNHIVDKLINNGAPYSKNKLLTIVAHAPYYPSCSTCLCDVCCCGLWSCFGPCKDTNKQCCRQCDELADTAKIIRDAAEPQQQVME